MSYCIITAGFPCTGFCYTMIQGRITGWTEVRGCPGDLTTWHLASAHVLHPLHFLVPVFPRRWMLGLGVTGALQGFRYGSPQKNIIVLVVKSPGWTKVLDVDQSPRWWT